MSNGTAAILFHWTVRRLEAWNGNFRNYWQQEMVQWFPSAAVPADTTAVSDNTTIQRLIVGYPEKPGITGFDSWFQSIGRQLDQKLPGWIGIPFKPWDWTEQTIYRLSQEHDRAVFIGFNIREANDREKLVITTDLYLSLPEKGMGLDGSELAAIVLARIGGGSLRKQDRDKYALYEISWKKRITIIRERPLQANLEYWSGLKSALDALLEKLVPERRTGIRFD